MFKFNKETNTLKVAPPVNPLDKANAIITSATNMFQTAIRQVDAANSILEAHHNDKEIEFEILKEQMESAVKEMEAAKIATAKNNELKSKLSQFVG